MAGIALIYRPDGSPDGQENALAHMCAALRRTDREGPLEWFSTAGAGAAVGIGRCRPALTNRAPQPLWNETRTVCALFHGELFSLPERRRSLEGAGHVFSGTEAAELVTHLYEERGDSFVEHLNGGFVLALWDSRRRALLIANDRYGLKPLYTARIDGARLWASSPKALLAYPGMRRVINRETLADFLCLGVPQSEETMFDGITEVPPARLVICEDGRVTERRYWDLAFAEGETSIRERDAMGRFVFLLRQAAARRQEDGLRLGFLLSGGTDSRIVLSLLPKETIKTFTFGLPCSDDLRFARQVAQAAGVAHRSLEIRPDYLKQFACVGIERTEDLINCNQFHGLSVYDEIALECDALTTGSVGEDLFGHFNKDPKAPFWSRGFTADRYFDFKSVTTDSELEQLMAPPAFGALKGAARERFHRDFGACRSSCVTHRVDYWGVRYQQRRVYTRLAGLFPDTLQYRPLFFDNDLIDFVQTIPPSLRWGERSLYRRVLHHTAPALAALPTTTTGGLPLYATHREMTRHAAWLRRRRFLSRLTGGIIPSGIERRSYVDYDQWLRTGLRGWMETILRSRTTLDRGVWRPAGLEQLMADHRRGYGPMRNMAAKLMAIISFELWCRIYIDGSGR